jgi:hypothetical protein
VEPEALRQSGFGYAFGPTHSSMEVVSFATRPPLAL